jgi:DNA invertase Pin-like site-specific DNA recombinase
MGARGENMSQQHHPSMQGRPEYTPLSTASSQRGVEDTINPTPVRRAAIYVRKSHFTEGKSKSIADQIKDCLRVAAKLGLTVAEEHIYMEAEGNKGDWTWSGSGDPGPYRVALGRMMDDMDAGLFDLVVVWKSDRMYRDCGLADDILKRMRANKVALVCGGYDYLIHTATGFARASLEAVSNREQRDKASEDIKRTLGERVLEGQITRSPACLGYRSAGADTQAVRAIPEELALVNRIFRMFLIGEDSRGPLGVTAISRQLVSEGTFLPALRLPDQRTTPKDIGAGKIRRILEHVAYIGKFKHAGREYDCPSLLVPAADGSGNMETAVPLQTWLDAQDKLARETKWDKKCNGLGTPHLLTGYVICGNCGRTTYALQRRVPSGPDGQEEQVRSNYRCLRKHELYPCKGLMPCLSEPVLDAWVLSELTPLLIHEIKVAHCATGRDADIQALAGSRLKLEAACQREAAELQRVLNIYDDMQLRAKAAEFRAVRETMMREIAAIQERLNKSGGALAQLPDENVADMPRAALRAALQSATEWIMVSSTGVIALTRMGTYIAARYRKGDRARGEHPILRALEPASVVDALTCLAWFPNPAAFLEGRRETLGAQAASRSDEDILPGLTAYQTQRDSQEIGYVPEFPVPTDIHKEEAETHEPKRTRGTSRTPRSGAA